MRTIHVIPYTNESRSVDSSVYRSPVNVSSHCLSRHCQQSLSLSMSRVIVSRQCLQSLSMSLQSLSTCDHDLHATMYNDQNSQCLQSTVLQSMSQVNVSSCCLQSLSLSLQSMSVVIVNVTSQCHKSISQVNVSSHYHCLSPMSVVFVTVSVVTSDHCNDQNSQCLQSTVLQSISRVIVSLVNVCRHCHGQCLSSHCLQSLSLQSCLQSIYLVIVSRQCLSSHYLHVITVCMPPCITTRTHSVTSLQSLSPVLVSPVLSLVNISSQCLQSLSMSLQSLSTCNHCLQSLSLQSRLQSISLVIVSRQCLSTHYLYVITVCMPPCITTRTHSVSSLPFFSQHLQSLSLVNVCSLFVVCSLCHCLSSHCLHVITFLSLQDLLCCSVLQCAAVFSSVLHIDTIQNVSVIARLTVLQCVAVCCSVLQCVAAGCSVLQCVACRHYTERFYHGKTYCNTLQHTSTHCNTLQHTALLITALLIFNIHGFIINIYKANTCRHYRECMCVYMYPLHVCIYVCIYQQPIDH